MVSPQTFFRELPAIDEHTRAIEQAYTRRHTEAVQARAAAYTEAFATVRATPGWEQLNDDQQQRVTAPLATRATTDGADGLSIPLLRADLHACSGLCNKAIEEMVRLVDGSRVVRVHAASYLVAYPRLADILSGPLPSHLRRLTQRVMSPPNRFSTPRLPRLTCL